MFHFHSLRIVTAYSLFIFSAVKGFSQKIYPEGKISYKIEAKQAKQGASAEAWLKNSNYMMFIKASQTRTELKTDAGLTITLHDSKLKNGALMNEYGNQKILVRLADSDIADQNKKYEDMVITLQDEKKTIAGYECRLALVKLKDSTVFRVFYAPALQFQNSHYDSPFHNLPGFPLEFESAIGKNVYRYVAEQIDFTSVPSSLFDIPKTGYKVMSYSEVKLMQNN
jgi:GLPGLI family protein